MPRKRNELGPNVEGQIAEFMKVGRTAQHIFETLSAQGVRGISVATITRRMREIRAGLRSSRAAPSAPESSEDLDLPESPESIGADTPLEILDQWIAHVARLGRKAAAADDLDGIGKMGRLSAALLEARRKATPPPVADPNDSPDMVALGALVAEKFHSMISRVVGAPR
jgi:hypothetical protein